MQIEFGWSLDGAAWADASSAAATGTVRLGPQGLVTLLQTRLALTRPAVDPAVRIAQYARAIAAVDHPWPRESFAVDPWSTASTLLAWRDAAVAAGARLEASDGLPERIAALRAVESAASHLAPGSADDMRELVDVLAEEVTWSLGIETLRCHEAPTSLPGLWPQLLQLLEARGVVLEQARPAQQERPELVLVEAEDEWTAAEAAARLLAGRDSAPLQLLAGADTVLLDQELHRRGLPAVGVAESAAHRTALQILPLYLSVAVAPVDVQQLAALLDLRVLDVPEGGREHVGLVPARARALLLDALAHEPGTGGTAWQQAMAGLEADEELSASGLEMLRALSALVTSPLTPEDLTPERVRDVTAPLGKRLRALGQGDPALVRASTHLQVVLDVLDELEPGRVLRQRELAQIVATAGGRAGSPFARPGATSRWRTCSRPSQLLPIGGDVLWWGADRDDAAAGVTWDAAEAEALTGLGARILAPAQVTALGTDAGLRGLHGAERIVVVRTRRRAEKPTAQHALLAHLAARRAAPGQDVEKVLEGLTLSPAETLGADGFALAGSRRPLTVPAPSRIAPLPSDLTKHAAPAPHLLPSRLSYSQAEDLLGCRQKWTFKNGLQIRAASVATVPTGNRMIGTLVHAVVEQLAGDGERTPSAQRIGREIDTQVPRLASELLLPGREVELVGLRERAVRSLVEFFDRLGAAGMVITSVESRFEEPLLLHLRRGDVTVPFVGYRDVDAEDARGRPTVIDLKWTYAARKYPELFEAGEALQLASYAHSLHEEGTDVGYFLLSQGEFVSANPALDPHGRPTLDVEDLWSRGTAGMTRALDEIGAGRVDAHSGQILLDAGQDLATPRKDAEKTYTRAREAARAQGSLVVDARCDHCEFSLLCGMRGDVS